MPRSQQGLKWKFVSLGSFPLFLFGLNWRWWFIILLLIKEYLERHLFWVLICRPTEAYFTKLPTTASAGPVCVSTRNNFHRHLDPRPPRNLSYNPRHLFYVQRWPMWELAETGCQMSRCVRHVSWACDVSRACWMQIRLQSKPFATRRKHLLRTRLYYWLFGGSGFGAVQTTELRVLGCTSYSRSLGLMLTRTFLCLRRVHVKLFWVLLLSGERWNVMKPTGLTWTKCPVLS